MDFLTRIDPTRPLNRLLKGAGRNAAEGMREELVKAADYVFDQKVAPLIYIINCMITDKISQAQNVAKGIVYDITDLKDECKSDIEELLTNVDAKYKDNLRLTFAEINQARAEAILDVRQTIGYIDQSIESRINQLFSELMIFFKSVTEVVDKFTPNEIKNKLIDPTFDRFDRLENQLFNDLDQLIDKIARASDFSVEDVREKLLKGLEIIDKKSGIRKESFLPVLAINLTDMELYEYRNWVELDKINKAIAANDSIEKNILNSYMQLQINASRMSFRAKALRIEPLHNKCRQDYVKYGISIELWTGCLA